MRSNQPSTLVPEAFGRFGDLLRFLRQRAQLTQRDLSIAVGYNFAHISRLESGQRLPDPIVIAATFVPALELENTSAWAERLIELANQAARQQVEEATAIELGAPPVPAPAPPAAHSASPARAAPILNQPRHNLPAQLTPFIGRETELANIQNLLEQPSCRLLTVVGPGGIGKTRLALAAAAGLLDRFVDGVFFITFASLSSGESILSAVAEGLNIQLLGSSTPEAQIVAYLRPRRLLLLLDNFEHVLGSAGSLARILESASQVRALVTSRERLNLSAETIYRLDGMGYPESDALRGALEYGAVQLLMQSARMTRPNLEPQAYDLEQMVRICRLVAGMPLALVMAASWLEVLPFGAIADEIAASLDFLETELRDVPERQRSVRAVFDVSWNRLPPEAQSVFMKLSVFRGGWNRHAAEVVAGANLRTLQMLVNTSFITAGQDERYAVHELLRQYGAEHLRASGELDAAQDAHCTFFLLQMRRASDDLKGGRQPTVLTHIEADLDNIRTGWYHAIDRKDGDTLERAAEGFCLYHEMRGALSEGEVAFAQAAAALIAASQNHTTDSKHIPLCGFLLACQGMLCAHRGNLHEGQILLEQGISFLHESQHHQLRSSHTAFALLWLGWSLFLQGNTARAEQIVQNSLERYTAIGDRWGIAKNLFILGNSLTARGQLTEAEPPLRESLAICQAIGDRRSSLLIKRNLAILTFWFGDYAQTRQLLDEAAQLSYEFNDRIGLAYILRESGKLELAEGQYAQTIQTLQHSIAITDDIGSRWESAATLDDLGVALRLSGDPAAAEQALQQCLAASEAINNRYYRARCLGDLGCLAYHMGAYDQAEQRLREALNLWKVIGHEPYQAWILCQLGSVVAATVDDPLPVRLLYRQALQLAARHKLAPFALDIFVGVAEVLARTAEADEAFRLLALAERHVSSTSETKQKARRLLKGLTGFISNQDIPEAEAVAASLDWQPTARRIIEVLTVPPE